MGGGVPIVSAGGSPGISRISKISRDLQGLQSLGMGLSSSMYTLGGAGVPSASRREMSLAATASECHVPATWAGGGRKEVPPNSGLSVPPRQARLGLMKRGRGHRMTLCSLEDAEL